MERKKAVLLLSGGLDSATTAAIAHGLGYELAAMTFLYGQRHRIELESARKLVSYFNIGRHVVVELVPEIFASALVEGSGIEIPAANVSRKEGEIPETYVPARNIIFLSYGLAYAESIGSTDIFIGVNAVDYSGYPDCRPEFIEAFTRMANIGTRTGSMGGCFVIHAPLLKMKKSEIITTGTGLGVDYSMTHSCYNPVDNGTACGECDSCVIRKDGFAGAGMEDPIHYKKS